MGAPGALQATAAQHAPGIPFQGPRPQQWSPRAEPHSLTGAEAGGALSGSSVLTGLLQAAPGESSGEAATEAADLAGGANGEGEVAS